MGAHFKVLLLLVIAVGVGIVLGEFILYVNGLLGQCVLYVDDDYATSEQGFGITKFKVIQDAIDGATDGCSVYVSNGTYYENIVMKENVNLTGEGADVAIIDGSLGSTRDDPPVVEMASNTKISGFLITAPDFPEDQQIDGILVSGVKCNIENNIIRHVKRGGIFVVFGGDVLIKNNIIDNNGKNDGNYNYGGISVHSSSAIIKNNIISNNGYKGIESGIGPLTISHSYNNFWKNLAGAGVQLDSSETSQDPLFVDSNVRNYHLQPNSPNINAGDPSDPVPAGGGSRIDIGAFEFTGIYDYWATVLFVVIMFWL